MADGCQVEGEVENSILFRGVVVEKGESLSSIAGACTGDPDRYPELAVCNGLPDADHIEPGQVLILPEPWLLCRF